MELDLLGNGSEYISAGRAAKKVGYSADYIGQLCRAQKIPGKLIERTWYVELEALLAHREHRHLGKPRKARVFAEPHAFPARALPRLSSLGPPKLNGALFSYERDERPLLPALSKEAAAETAPFIDISYARQAAALTLTLIILVGAGTLMEKNGLAQLSFSQSASASLSNIIANALDAVVSGFQDLKHSAITQTKPAETAPAAARFSPPPAAVPDQSIQALSSREPEFSLEAIKGDLKTELLSYVRANLPQVQTAVSVSAPAYDPVLLRNEILQAAANTVLRQSEADSGHRASLIANVTVDGAFSNPTISGGSISNATGQFTALTATDATSSTLAITGNGAGLAFYGSGNHDISAQSGTLRIGSNVIIGNITALDNSIDIGTPATRFDKIYADEVNATTLVGTLVGGNLSAETFSINSDNATDDAEDSYLAFERGSASPNAVIQWDSANKKFAFNFGVLVDGRLGIGTSTPAVSLDIYGTDAARIPVGTTIQRPAGDTGMIRYNTTSNTFEGYGNGSWQGLGGVIDTDQDTYITADTGGADEDALRFYTAGTQKLAVLSGGFVGVGTSSPSHLLTLSTSTGPQLTLTDGTGATNMFSFRNIGGNLYLATSSPASHSTSTNAVLAINGITGQVGIGTSTPQAGLHIVKNYTDALNMGLRLTGSIPGMAFESTNSANSRNFNIINNYSADGQLELNYSSTFAGNPDTNALRIDALNNYVRFSQSVGIGTAPVAGNTLDVRGRIQAAPSSAEEAIYLRYNISTNGILIGATSNSGFIMKDANGRPLFSVTAAGKVGAGTTSPYAKLSAAGSDSGSTLIAADAISGFGGNLLDLMVASSSKFVVSGSGYVGIGTTSPWAALAVAGKVALPNLSNSGTGYYACVNTASGGAELATSTTACGASSLRYKENVQDLSYGLEQVLNMRPVSFDWKRDFMPDGTHQIGFIAEEMKDVIPEIIGYDSHGQVMNLDYPKLTSVIVKAMQQIARVSGEFKETLIAWFADTANGITAFFAKEVHTEKLCVKKSDGTDICVTGDELSALVSGSYSAGGGIVTVSPQPEQNVGTSTESTVGETGTSTTESTAGETSTSTEPVTGEIGTSAEPAIDSGDSIGSLETGNEALIGEEEPQTAPQTETTEVSNIDTNSESAG